MSWWKPISLFFLMLGLNCGSHLPYMPYHYTEAKTYAAAALRIIPIYVDQDFAEGDLLALDSSVRQWNYVLNGYVDLEIVTTHFQMEPEVIREALHGEGWIILKIDSSSKLFHDKNALELTLAFCDQVGGHLLYVIRDRLDNEDMPGIFLHEMGHLLGAKDGTHDLMNGSYTRLGTRCVDQSAAEEVAVSQGIPASQVNYCLFGEQP